MSGANAIEDRLLGEAGTTVHLAWLDSTATEQSVDLTRSGYISTTIDYQMTAGDVGYIKIRQFDATTLSELDYAIRTLRNAGAASLLFDLRDNAGGLLDAALNCIDLICPEGVMAWAESRDGTQEVLGTSSGDSVVDLPIVCLVNGNTASAAELFASCLRDMSGARLVGSTTYGKGTIQSSPQRLSDGSAVVVTVARLIASNGESFDTTGLTVDVERPLTSDEQVAFYDFTLETDPQILRAVNAAQTLTGSATVGGVNAASSQAASSEDAAGSEASTQAIQALEDLAGKTVGVQLGTTGDLLMSEEVGKADGLNLAGVEQYNKAADAVQALLTNKIDAVCIDDQVAKNFVAANPDELTMLDTAFAEESYAIAVSKDNPDLTEQLNGAIAELKENGTLDAILDKYIAKVEGATGYVSPEGTEYPNGTLVMATNATFDPYEYIENGEIVGIDAEFAKALCDKLGYDLHIEDMEFDSIIAAVNSGKADFGMAGMTVTPERQEQIDFTDTYCTAAQSIIVLK